jgi:hypothetical protein
MPGIVVNVGGITLNLERPKPSTNIKTTLVHDADGLADFLVNSLGGRQLAAAIAAGANPHPAASRPLKTMGDGKRVDSREAVTDHVALLFPDTGWMIGVDTLCLDDERPFGSHQAALNGAKACRLLDYDDWSLADDVVYSRHVIDRRFHKPAADPNLYPRLLLSDWYWTSTITAWSQSAAFSVNLHLGYVDINSRDNSGFGLACRRARQ